ncbi:hypothetical protein B0J11DRAFT_526714 [Dendryphion nanum]|uniref:SMP-LTD domain-containing protein n=1 Tax=Dendryphion nanum TaxID=256645 RepID=A0A9P9DW89_9PLEO|nr:hypothetical protein B0J11DRAFT_526714 [Dendryphion nanum]
MSLSAFLFIYVLGGITFIPLVLSIAFLHAYITQPERTEHAAGNANGVSKNDDPLEGVRLSDGDFEGLPSELKTRTHVPDVAAGYFAVCREYVPGGINGKPPERTTPAGAVVAAESPSVYQTMYRSIFDRNKTMSPTMDGANGKSKKARNVFYVVLRLGHLMLYDDSEQLEVRHVISLQHYDVDIYAGGEKIPEGELWIKRNCIRLASRQQLESNSTETKPFFLFSENCSEKEDFYHAMLQSQERRTEQTRTPPVPLKFHTPDLVKLVQQLHADEENLNTRWINALIGRLFLAVYKTKDVENFIWTKMTKKIARVPKPALISSINLQKVDMGTLPPFLTNPKLKELTVDGDMIVEADVSYKGNFRVEISAIARIDLGTRFKAREVSLVLATTLRKLDGHILLRIKPPPSNRLWMTFESVPKMELVVEPIVSSRQITYGVILRAIESRLREVVSETLVYPNWDDMPFSDTILNQFRGGIWTSNAAKDRSTVPNMPTGADDVVIDDKIPESESDPSTPSFRPNDGPLLSRKKTASSADLNADAQSIAFSSAVDKEPTKPKAIRSGSFSSAANPIVSMNLTSASATKSEVQLDAASSMRSLSQSQPNSPTESPVGSLKQPSSIHNEERRPSTAHAEDQADPEGEDDKDFLATLSPPSSATLPILPPRPSETEDIHHISHARNKSGSSLPLPRNTFGPSAERRQTLNQSFNTATAVAKKWFASKQNNDVPPSPRSALGTKSPRPSSTNESGESSEEPEQGPNLAPTSKADINAPLGSPAHPIGRGQPLPPPGTPLPGPPKPEKRNNSGWSVPTASTFVNLTKRKPVAPKTVEPDTPQNPSPPPPPLPNRNPTISHPPSHSHKSSQDRASVGTAAMGVRRKSNSLHQLPSPGVAPSRRQRRSVTDAALGNNNRSNNSEEGLFVVAAPPTDNSAPPSPLPSPLPGSEKNKEHLELQSGTGGIERKSVDEGVFQGMEGVP